MAKKGTITIDQVKCKGCELCVVACPFNLIEMTAEVNAKGYHFANLGKEGCTACMNCAVVCPDSIITVYSFRE